MCFTDHALKSDTPEYHWYVRSDQLLEQPSYCTKGEKLNAKERTYLQEVRQLVPRSGGKHVTFKQQALMMRVEKGKCSTQIRHFSDTSTPLLASTLCD